MMLAPCSTSRVPPKLVPLPGSRYGNCFPGGLFVKKVLLKGQIEKITCWNVMSYQPIIIWPTKLILENYSFF
jgi:hypothetical protein